MKQLFLTIVGLAVWSSTANAWNNKGHMTVARLAWNELSPEERGKVVAILKKHPHIDAFLRADRPSNFTEDEWIFLRAATWSDWVRNGPPKRQYSVPDRHFIDIPIIAEGSMVTLPPLKKENAINGINEQQKIAMSAADGAKQAVAVTWLLHLLGDIHQPLHAATRYSDRFPKGDRGGNDALIRINGGSVIQMHHFWDGQLGTSLTRSSILGTVAEIESLAKDHNEALQADLTKHTTPEDWAKESNALAKTVAYNVGRIEPANSEDHPEKSDVPSVNEDYATKAGETARLCAYKGGKRLAAILKKIVAE